MKEYIKSLHTKPVHHQKRFAFLVASTVTLVIFASWSLVVFHDEEEVVVDNRVGNLAAAVESTPFSNILSSIRSTWKSLVGITSDGQ